MQWDTDYLVGTKILNDDTTPQRAYLTQGTTTEETKEKKFINEKRSDTKYTVRRQGSLH